MEEGHAGGFRPPVPAPDTAVAWPEAFGQRFTIFVDTEEEFDWSAPFSRDARATTAAAAIPVAARRFASADVAPVYLVDHPIATDPAAVDAIGCALGDGRSAVGTQLHPWVNPPFDEAVTIRNSFAGNLPPALEAAKLDVLSDAIADAFGERPIAYRAGRYGLGPQTIALLAARGYRIDTSMRARHDYRRSGGPDYRAIGNAAFHAGHDIVELPLTTVYTGALRGAGAWLHPPTAALPFAGGVLARTGLLARVALTPEDMPLADALEAVRIVVGEGLPLLNFSFHSPSLVPGHTPYVRDAGDLDAFWRWWDAVFALLARLGTRYATLAEIDAASRLA